MNNDETIFSNFSFYMCINIKKSLDKDLEFLSVPKDLPMRPIFGGKSDFFMYHVFGIPPDKQDNKILFKYKSKNYSLDINRYNGELVHDFLKMSHEFGVINITSVEDPNFENLYTLFQKAHEEFDKFIQNTRTESMINIYIAEGVYWDTVDRHPHRPIDSIYLPKDIKDSVISNLDNFYNPETLKIYKTLGITHKRVFLFEGVAGTGKTSFITALASKYGYCIATLYFNSKLDDNSLVRLIKNMPSKCWLLLEDMDYLFQDRKSHDSAKNMITLSGLLNCLDGISTKDGFVCWLTTNNKQALDSALIRPGRVDQIVKFDYAVPEQAREIYKNFMADKYTIDAYEVFQTSINRLHIKYTTSLLQQYLLPYIGNPEAALKNIEEMKNFYTASIVDAGADNMYN